MRFAEYRPGPAAGTLALIAATALALATAGGGAERAPAPAAGQADALTLAEAAVRAAPTTARRVERLRGLDFRTVPRPEVVSAADLGAIERRELRRRDELQSLAADEAIARIAGLLADDEELEAARGSTEQLAAAAYDPRTDSLYVIRDAVSANATLVEFLLAHELTHALEDQRYGLADPGAVESDDAALARLALTEGTATALMVDYAGRHLNPLELGLATADLDEGTGDVPAFVVDQLEWTYLGGMRFVDTLRELADGWKLVNYALGHRPPETTEQVLHPLKYVRDEGAIYVSAVGDELGRRGWRRADTGVLGELATRTLLELGNSRAAARGAAGWGGDRYELWRSGVAPSECAETCRGDLVLAMRWRMEGSRDAAELEAALRRYARDGLDGQARAGGFALAGGHLAVRANGADTVAVFAPTQRLAAAVAGDEFAN